MTAGLAVDQLAYDYADEPVVFIEHDPDSLRANRFWSAHGSGTVGYPMVIVDSGHRYTDRNASGTNFYNVYKGFVDAELARQPKAEVSAQYTRVSNHFQVQVKAKNLSGVTLSSSNGATVVVIVYEDALVEATSRYARGVVQQTFSSALANNAERTFTLNTPDLDPWDWGGLHVLAMVEYRPSGSNAYDTLQAAIATPGGPLTILPNPILFMIDEAAPADQTQPLTITGGDMGLSWEVTSKPDWLTVSPVSAETVGTPAEVTALASGLSPGANTGNLIITFSGSGDPFTRTIPVTAYLGEIKLNYLPTIIR
jgi:hypothetical protein